MITFFWVLFLLGFIINSSGEIGDELSIFNGNTFLLGFSIAFSIDSSSIISFGFLVSYTVSLGISYSSRYCSIDFLFLLGASL